MKKVLFATTALIATAGMAAADVRISGYGRFGLDYNDGNDGLPTNTTNTTDVLEDNATSSITSRLRLQFDMSAETDGGVAFNARFRAQAESRDGNAGGATFNGARFGVSFAGFTVNVGNIIGAIENTPGLYLETRTAGIGIDGAGFESLVTNVNGRAFDWDAYSSAGTGANGVELLYSAGGFNGHISYSKADDSYISDGTGVGPVLPANLIAGTERTALNLAYTFGDWTAAVGYQDSNVQWEDKVLVTVAGDLGMFGVRLAYADNDGISKYGLYGNVEIGAASTLVAYVTNEDDVSAGDIANGRTNANAGGTGYGIHYSYDLGGGVSFEAGARNSSRDNTTAQAGVYFSF
jgi:outer membrane protein OmpU